MSARTRRCGQPGCSGVPAGIISGDVTPDGGVWALAVESYAHDTLEQGLTAHLYVITPEVVADTE